MKIYMSYIAIVAVAMIMFAAPAVGQTSPDSVNGWDYLHTLEGLSNMHFTNLDPDHVQGNSSQSFTYRITSYDNRDSMTVNPGVGWEKTLDSTYDVPTHVIFAYKVVTISHQFFNPAVDIYLVHGDTTVHTGSFIMGDGWHSQTMFINNNAFHLVGFNKVEFRFASEQDTGSAQILVDSLMLKYTWGTIMLDPFEQPATFSTSPTAVQFSNTLLTTSSTTQLTAYATGSPLPLRLDSITSSNPVFSVDPNHTTIGPNDSATFNITFTPPDTGTYTGQLVFHHLNGATPADTVPVSGSCTIPDSSKVVSLSFSPGWQMVSLPITPAEGTSTAHHFFRYTGSYASCYGMQAAIGYWHKVVPGESPLMFVGNSFQDTMTLPVQVHWNIIGSVSHPVAVSQLASFPSGLTASNFFGYNGSGYFVADTIYPGHAYWVKVTQDGHLAENQPNNALAKAQGFSPLRIVDNGELPPPPPGGYVQTVPRPAVPKEFALEQNYPNPFNPSTTISYALPQAALVTLTVYNTLGQEMATLVNEQKVAGTYTAVWNANTAPSGVYFYRLQAGSYTNTQKMLLVK